MGVLRIVSEKCRFEETRALAMDKERPQFEQRLSSFKQVIRRRPVSSHRHELVVASDVDLHGRAPRSGSQIRRVLRSIRILINRARSRRRMLCWRLRRV